MGKATSKLTRSLRPSTVQIMVRKLSTQAYNCSGSGITGIISQLLAHRRAVVNAHMQNAMYPGQGNPIQCDVQCHDIAGKAVANCKKLLKNSGPRITALSAARGRPIFD